MTSAHTTPIEALLAEQQWLHELARHLVGDPEAALDLEQETWLAALRSPPAHAGSPRGWLATVLRRLARRRAEGERHGREREFEAARVEALPGAAAGA
ncbi:MAG TPA: sigma factor, partial [Planctomycetota bacterium]|nr:sigma factor [Planctomycetota bacterium]